MDVKKLQKINTKQKVAMSIVFFVIFILSIVFFVAIPSINDIRRIRADIERQRADLELKYMRGQNLKNISEKLAKVKPKINELDKVFISKNRNLDFITALEDLASKNYIEQRINLFEADGQGGAYSAIPIQLSATGSFQNIINYIIDIESMNYYINVNSLTLNSAGDDKEDATSLVNVLILATTYWE